MFSSWQTSYKQCDCVCVLFLLARPRLIMSLSAANLKSNPVQFSSPGRDHERGPGFCPFNKTTLGATRPSPAAPDSVFECHHCQLKAPYCNFLASHWSERLRSVSYWLPLPSWLPVMSIMPEIATNQATDRL